jgi:N-acylglucosamine-6-phosphate 2-epimerase
MIARLELHKDLVSIDPKISTFLPLKGGLVVSCQVPDGTATNTPEFIAAQAQTVIQAGAVGIRAQGLDNVRAVAKVTNVPIIGLVKRYSPSTAVFITPAIKDVLELEAAGASIVAIDATDRFRSDGVDLKNFLTQLRLETQIPLLADVDSFEAGVIAEALGCESVATTLSGYTEVTASPLPNIELLRRLANKLHVPLIAEGGYSKPEHFKLALEAGAWAVCVGTAITNPYLLTKQFLE